jgi:type IV pilus assembly protein PilO
MPDLKRTRNRLKIAIVALVMVDIAAIAMLVTPLAGMQETRQQQLRQLWMDLKSRESAPWRGLETKIPKAKQEIDEFYRARFPAEQSAISADFGKLAAEAGVRISGVKYSEKEAPIDGIERIEISADLSGDYLQLVRFINALERNKLFFIVDDLQLGGEQSGTVKLQIKAEIYQRTTS